MSRRLSILVLAGALLAGCLEINLGPKVSDDKDLPTSSVDCGRRAAWDGDGDGLSDAVERNNAGEGYHRFDLEGCDDDPSQARGSWDGGEVAGAVNLSDRGGGYIHLRGSDPVDGDDWGILELISCIEAVGRAWKASGRRLNVNDLSQRPGGEFPPHRSHQNGLDLDARYVRRDGRDHPLDLRYHPEDYDPLATQELLRLFLEHCDVMFIFADLERLDFPVEALGAGADTLRYAPGHSNHFHVRLQQP